MAFDPGWQGMRTQYVGSDHHVHELFVVPGPPPAGETLQTVFLSRQTVGVGAAFVYGGRWPTVGPGNGSLKKIALGRFFGSPLVELRFIKRDHSSLECDRSDAVVRLSPGNSLSGQDLVSLFGSQTPQLPVVFVACAVFNPPVPSDVPTAINIDITTVP
jgi:hypothetical protein